MSFAAAQFERVDIFCQVVDNFGDIGVCWRLARQLSGAFALGVRLWIDQPDLLGKLTGNPVDLSSDCFVEGIEIRSWELCASAARPAQVVIEAFGCEIPESFQQAMAALPQPPLWINLEYLSAEGWIDGCHGLPSRHPRLALQKHFFFPGFSADCGGLLREAGLEAAREAFLADPAGVRAWLSARGVGEEAEAAFRISLFAYEQPALAGLLPLWQAAPRPVSLRVPEGRVLASLEALLGVTLRPGQGWQRGSLSIHVLPFMTQPDYDRLLWCSDLNCVRGEDSFVRAQWARRPFLWHIYPQVDGVHQDKLAAFLARYQAGLPAQEQAALNAIFQAWNDPQIAPDVAASAWQGMLAGWPRLQAHAGAWGDSLAAQQDLAGALVQFCNARVK